MDMNQGMLQQTPQSQTGMAPVQGSPTAQAGTAPAGMEQHPQNMSSMGQPQGAQMGTPQPERDYQANPLNATDKDNVDKFTIMGTKLIHTPQTRQKILDRIKGVDTPHNEIADAAYAVIKRIDEEGKKQGEPWDKAVLIMGGQNVVNQVVELAEAANKVPAPPTEDDVKIITGKVVQRYYKEKMATGEITKEEAARDAQLAAVAKNDVDGGDTTQLSQRVDATQQIKQSAQTAPKKGLLNQPMETPQPQANPMKPTTTMKEVLATGQGGILQ